MRWGWFGGLVVAEFVAEPDADECAECREEYGRKGENICSPQTRDESSDSRADENSDPDK